MSIETALLRADQYIQKQMLKFEQQKRGRQSPPRVYAGYGQIKPSRDSCGRPPSQNYGSSVPQYQSNPPPQAPLGWRQEFDTKAQRWYYIDLATGRAQWDPPSRSQPPPRAQTFANEHPSRREDGLRSGHRHRAISQPQRPISSSNAGPYLDVERPGSGRSGASVSPHPSPHGRLPPGAHLDMKTGQLVSSMFPPDHHPDQWAQEVGRSR